MLSQIKNNLCVKCDTIFSEWSSYHLHIITNKCARKIVPVRTSNRTHNEIVSDIEKMWGNALIG